jgi:dimeric dUTPase (all-alpha-NTP-PPase superfamily)
MWRIGGNGMKSLAASLKELFEIQAGLDSEINKKHPLQEGENRLEKKETALLVELGEMMNEVREFKFWSTDQKRRVNAKCRKCGGSGGVLSSFIDELGLVDTRIVKCDECDGNGTTDYVLKELVDGLHFVLSIGLEMMKTQPSEALEIICEEAAPRKWNVQTIEGAFNYLIKIDWTQGEYETGLDYFLGFCEKLGYTWDQVAAAYLEKNHLNHMRLLNGY